MVRPAVLRAAQPAGLVQLRPEVLEQAQPLKVVVKVEAPTVFKVVHALKAAPEQKAERAVASKAAGLAAVVVAAWVKPVVVAMAMVSAFAQTIEATAHASS